MSNPANSTRPKVQIWTDGSCHPNPNGPGGWACILKFRNHVKELSGHMPSTTNNRAEVTALIEALKALKRPCDVTWTTDSEYAIHAFDKARKLGTAVCGLKASVKNPDLIRELKEVYYLGQHKVFPCWVQGHVGHVENERCDVLAGEARKIVTVNFKAA